MATQNFINECKRPANANRLAKFGLQLYEGEGIILYGETTQSLEPTITNPVPLVSKTGTIVEEIDNVPYTFDLGNIELRGIGNYISRIYKSDDKWYVENKVKKRVLNGTENWQYTSNKKTYYLAVDDIIVQNIQSNMMDLTDKLKNYGTTLNNDSSLTIEYGFFVNNQYIHIRNKNLLNKLTQFKSWLSENNITIVYPLATPEVIEITDTTLINELENPTYQVNQSDNLVSIELKDSCIANNEILGTIFTKSADVKVLNLPIGTELVSKVITPQIGVKYSDDSTEYVTFDDYTIESVKDEQTASNTEFTAMNGGTLLDKQYVCSLSFENGQTHTINEFYQDACNQNPYR